ncbi:hypothetical protein HAX54_006854 [Datura stramonium]|uniref:Uncharacterized protein n=1 Tax=Datura stramonium TaxID=4076 RepID=A0ABS8TAV9_DATST|nr:hypothetical protein [Datura stramonium]
MNAQRCKATRLQKLANAQAKGDNQHATNNENDYVIRDEENEWNVEDVAPGNHRQPQRARGKHRQTIPFGYEEEDDVDLDKGARRVMNRFTSPMPMS